MVNNKSFYYHVYGLLLKSNQPMPGLMDSPETNRSDVEVCFNNFENDSSFVNAGEEIQKSLGFAENGDPFFKLVKDRNDSRAFLRIQYTNGKGRAVFHISQDGTRVEVFRPDSIPFNDTITYFLGPVIGCVLRLREVTCLHGGVVSVNGQALAVIGPKGMGKSTTIAAFGHKGYAVLSDDIIPLFEYDGDYYVHQGYPLLRLWPNTITAFPELKLDELPQILSISEKRFLKLAINGLGESWRFCDKPLKIEAVYVLTGITNQTVEIKAQSKAKGLIALSGNVYPEYSLNKSDMSRNFNFLSQFISSVPVRKLFRTKGLQNLSVYSDAILNDFQSL